jgi:hypothetical protein
MKSYCIYHVIDVAKRVNLLLSVEWANVESIANFFVPGTVKKSILRNVPFAPFTSILSQKRAKYGRHCRRNHDFKKLRREGRGKHDAMDL